MISASIPLFLSSYARDLLKGLCPDSFSKVFQCIAVIVQISYSFKLVDGSLRHISIKPRFFKLFNISLSLLSLKVRYLTAFSLPLSQEF